MKQEEFIDQIVNKRIEHCKALLLGEKNAEYSRGNDRLHNFKVAAAMDGESPAKALWGMWKKHIVSVRDIVSDMEAGILPSKQKVEDKMSDMINYALLLEAVIEEARANQKQATSNLESAVPLKFIGVAGAGPEIQFDAVELFKKEL